MFVEASHPHILVLPHRRALASSTCAHSSVLCKAVAKTRTIVNFIPPVTNTKTHLARQSHVLEVHVLAGEFSYPSQRSGLCPDQA